MYRQQFPLQLGIVAILIGFTLPRWARAADALDVPKPNAPLEPAGMKAIFDGKTLEGWDGDPRLWSVKDGVLRGETTAEAKANGNTFLIWKGGEPGDFELRLSFRNDHGNSGIQYRSKLVAAERRPQNPWTMTGYQAEIENTPGKIGFLYHEKGPAGRGHPDRNLYLANVGERVEIDESGKSSVVGSLGDKAAIGSTYKKSDWNDYIIIARGNRLQHFLNGIQTIDVVDNDPKNRALRGQIALQLHAGQPMLVEFKEIRLKQYDEAKPGDVK